MKQPVILVTNDDGIHSEGIKALADILKPLGNIVVVAPLTERSGSSHALTLDTPMCCTDIDNNKIAVDGTPADCVKYAMLKLFCNCPPALVVSGINRGANLGDDINYSGTVAAAVEGAMYGVPSIAFSVAGKKNVSFHEVDYFVYDLAGKVMKHGLPRDAFLNVNIPNIKRKQMTGIKVTAKGKRIYYDKIVEERKNGKKFIQIIGTKEAGWHKIGGTDLEAVSKQMISITPLHVNFRYSSFLKMPKKWKFLLQYGKRHI